MRGITPEGKLYLMVQEWANREVDVVGFLKHLARHIGGKLLVIWDEAPIHRIRVVKEYLSNGAAHQIHLEQVPGYAPELNPAEGIWNYLKGVELKNLCCQISPISPMNSIRPQTASGARPMSFWAASSNPGSITVCSGISNDLHP